MEAEGLVRQAGGSGRDPAYVRLATAFDRSILSARIHLIYHVTIQKRGALENGLARFEEARKELTELDGLVRSTRDLAPLQPEATRLAANFSQYELTLRRIVPLVADKQNNSEEFNTLLTQWALSCAM